jgi:hypothetical protein
MNYEIKTLTKALEKAHKDGALNVNVFVDPRSLKLVIQYNSLVGEEIRITIAESGSELWNEITKTVRFT